MRDLAEALGKRGASSWQHYETRFKKDFLSVEIARAIAPVFERYGGQAEEIWSLTATGRPSPGAALGASTTASSKPLSEEMADLRRDLAALERRVAAIKRMLG